jgi:hypothetical protein
MALKLSAGAIDNPKSFDFCKMPVAWDALSFAQVQLQGE